MGSRVVAWDPPLAESWPASSSSSLSRSSLNLATDVCVCACVCVHPPKTETKLSDHSTSSSSSQRLVEGRSSLENLRGGVGLSHFEISIDKLADKGPEVDGMNMWLHVWESVEEFFTIQVLQLVFFNHLKTSLSGFRSFHMFTKYSL